VRALHRSVRNLFEMCLVSLLVRHRLRVPPSEYVTLSNRLPCFHEHNTALGVAMKSLLSGTDTGKLPLMFPTHLNVLDDLRRGCAFWDSVYRMAAVWRDEELISTAQLAELEGADRLLQNRRKALSLAVSK